MGTGFIILLLSVFALLTWCLALLGQNQRLNEEYFELEWETVHLNNRIQKLEIESKCLRLALTNYVEAEQNETTEQIQEHNDMDNIYEEIEE